MLSLYLWLLINVNFVHREVVIVFRVLEKSLELRNYVGIIWGFSSYSSLVENGKLHHMVFCNVYLMGIVV